MPRQPDLRQQLSQMLVAPNYEVAVLGCDQGDQQLCAIKPDRLVAIYRDGDIGAIQHLARR